MPLNVKRRTELLDLVPYGLVATRRWLLRAGMSTSALDNQIKSGQLLSVRPGVYVASRDAPGLAGRCLLP